MHLVIFDIDGTLIHTHTHEADCFIQAVKEVVGIEHIDKDLRSYKHVTDIGIAQECIERSLQRPPTSTELTEIETRFLRRFDAVTDLVPITPIQGVHALLNTLQNQNHLAIGIATGSYYQSALLKLQKANLFFDPIPLSSASDSHDRIEIMQIALNKAKTLHQVEHFETVTYVGDGPWDIQAVQALNWHFIALSSNYSEEQLTQWGAKVVLPDYTRQSEFTRYLNQFHHDAHLC